jgi:hypothetical protein
MPDIHVPKLEEHGRGHSTLKVLLEVLLISTGVFLGLAGEQYREAARHREIAQAALQRFRTEIIANRQAVAAVKDYHVQLRTQLHAAFEADAKHEQFGVVNMKGIQPASLDRTAWDLALAQQSLAYIDTDLAYEISQIYNAQDRLTTLSRELTQAMYVNPPNQNLRAFLAAVMVYYDDAVLDEPQLLEKYDVVLPKLDRMIGK